MPPWPCSHTSFLLRPIFPHPHPTRPSPADSPLTGLHAQMAKFFALFLFVALLFIAARASDPSWKDCGAGKALATQSDFTFDTWEKGSDFTSVSTFTANDNINLEGNWVVETKWKGWSSYTDKQEGKNKDWGNMIELFPSISKGKTFQIKNSGTFKSDLPEGSYTSTSRILDSKNNLIFCTETKWTF